MFKFRRRHDSPVLVDSRVHANFGGNRSTGNDQTKHIGFRRRYSRRLWSDNTKNSIQSYSFAIRHSSAKFCPELVV